MKITTEKNQTIKGELTIALNPDVVRNKIVRDLRANPEMKALKKKFKTLHKGITKKVAVEIPFEFRWIVGITGDVKIGFFTDDAIERSKQVQEALRDFNKEIDDLMSASEEMIRLKVERAIELAFLEKMSKSKRNELINEIWEWIFLH